MVWESHGVMWESHGVEWGAGGVTACGTDGASVDFGTPSEGTSVPSILGENSLALALRLDLVAFPDLDFDRSFL